MTPTPRSIDTALKAAVAAFAALLVLAPAAVGQAHDSEESTRCATDVMVIAERAPPQTSTGPVTVRWDAVADEHRTGPSVVYDVYRDRAEDVAVDGDEVAVTAENFLGTTAATEFRDASSVQDTEYVYAVVARGDVEDQSPESCEGEDIRAFDSDELDEEPMEPLPVVCELQAQALPDGVVRLTWTHAGEEYAVYRGIPESDRMTREARVSGGEFYERELPPGTTHEYMVTVWDDEAKQDVGRCNVVEVTAIPFFGGWVATALASVGALGAAVLAGRRLRG